MIPSLTTVLPIPPLLGIVVILSHLIHQMVSNMVAVNGDSSNGLVRALLYRTKEVILQLHQHIVEGPWDRQSIYAMGESPPLFTGILIMFLITVAWFIWKSRSSVYLVAFATWDPPESWKCSHEDILEICRRHNCFTEDSLSFLKRVLDHSGTGQSTAWPPGLTCCLKGEKPDRSIQGARKEAQTILFEVIQDALDKARLKPRDVDALVINCSIFTPTPSLCAMVASHFQMRSDIATYNLGGMGCSASILAIDLAKKLLLSGEHSRVLVVSTEILSLTPYLGNERSFLLSNTLFRCGGAAMVLSNRWHDSRRAWYKLLHTVRAQMTDQGAYECVFFTDDDTGITGVRLGKDIVKVAGKCMEKNFTMLGPRILPWGEQLAVVWSLLQIKFCKWYGWDHSIYKPYVPDFTKAVEHFCIHAGGRAVIDGVERQLRLAPYHVEASRQTLNRYGNTSSSSIWYELQYIQEEQTSNTLHRGDRVLQVAFGSGFKCNSAVWQKL